MLNLCIENICMEQRVIVVGAGLCGSLLALYLAQKGYHVHVYEKDQIQGFIFNQKVVRSI